MNITRLDKKDFEKVFEIMKEAFPPAEYRPKDKQLAILDDPDYSVTVCKDSDDICAFIACWKVCGFLFVEHLAVSNKMRNNGIGSEFVKQFLKTVPHPVVLEVEDLDDEISKRRIGFYQRLGFTLSDIRYDQPSFQKCAQRIPLRIMYCKNGFELDVPKIKDEIFKKVYKKA